MSRHDPLTDQILALAIITRGFDEAIGRRQETGPPLTEREAQLIQQAREIIVNFADTLSRVAQAVNTPEWIINALLRSLEEASRS